MVHQSPCWCSLLVYIFYLLNLHAVIYFVHCALSLIILFYICACCDTCYFKNVCLFLFVEVKALLGLCYMLYYYRHKIKFLCLCIFGLSVCISAPLFCSIRLISLISANLVFWRDLISIGWCWIEHFYICTFVFTKMAVLFAKWNAEIG